MRILVLPVIYNIWMRANLCQRTCNKIQEKSRITHHSAMSNDMSCIETVTEYGGQIVKWSTGKTTKKEKETSKRLHGLKNSSVKKVEFHNLSVCLVKHLVNWDFPTLMLLFILFLFFSITYRFPLVVYDWHSVGISRATKRFASCSLATVKSQLFWYNC